MLNKNEQKQQAIKDLKRLVKPDSEILVNIHSVSKSGMTRKMSAYVITKSKVYDCKKEKYVNKPTLQKLNFYIAEADVFKLDKNGYLTIGGCGMDMACDLSYSLKCALFGYEKGISNQQFRII